MRVRWLAVGVIGMALGAWPVHAAPTDGQFLEVARSLVERHILPRHAALAQAASRQREAVEALCQAPSAPAMATARAAFHTVMDRWMGVEHLRFGPIEQASRAHRLYFWPDARNVTARQLTQVLARGGPGEVKVDQLSVAVQGLPALEILLFEDLHATAVLSRGAEGGSRCALALGIARNVERVAADVEREWREGDGSGPSYRTQMTQPGPSQPQVRSPQEAVAKLLTGLNTTLELASDHRLAPPLGESVERARPGRAESMRSGRSFRNIAESMRALLAVLEGEGGPGLGALLRQQRDPRLAEDLAERLRDVAQVADDTKPALHEAVLTDEGRRAVLLLRVKIDALRGLITGRMVSALGLTLGFNSLDGD